MPRVSVVLPSYNHARFVAASVRSALDQDYADLEVIVCDDCSTDDSVEVLRGIADPRLKVLVMERNSGGAAAAHRAISHATGEFVAKLSSDDICLPGRIRKQVAWLDDHPEVDCVLALPEFIDDDGRVYEVPPPMAGAFASENRSRPAWLRHFFHHGNALCLPSAMMRRSALAEVCTSKLMFHHLPDFEFWVRFCLRFEIHVLEEKLVGYRLHPNGGNLSAPTAEKSADAQLEYLAVWRYFLTPEGLAAMGHPGGALGRLALAEESLAIGGTTRRLFALETLLETDMENESAEDCEEFLRRARPLMNGADALGMLDRARLREERDKWRRRFEESEATLGAWRKSWIGRCLARFGPKLGKRPNL